MAAPSNTLWGAVDGNAKGQLGIYVATSSTDSQITINTEIWFWSKYSIHDSVNTLTYNGESLGAVSIYTTSDSGGWSTDNQQLLHSAQHIYDRKSEAYDVSLSASLATIEVLANTISVSTTVTIPIINVWNDINVLSPDDIQDQMSGYFDLEYSDGNSYTDLLNETDATKPYGTVMTISNIRPYHEYYELHSVTGADDVGNGTYTNTMTTANHIIEIKMKYKSYSVNYYGNGGTWNGETIRIENATYNSIYTTLEGFFHKPGYEFKGWIDQDGNDWTSLINEPFTWTYTHNISLYAQWEPLNIAYYKQNGDWHLSRTYVKDGGVWKPAIMKLL